ncbi:MAG: SDR family oxidoreductase [Proteobacteria bacterium]|nr:SDR family oxidoreductase [Pseudomonadota bacterium]
MRLKDKVAVVTGAANGIGKGIALKFAEEGARIVANDISFLAAESVCDKIEETIGPDRAIPIEADVSKAEQVERLFLEAVEAFGRIDILVANAGVRSDAPIHLMTEAHWDNVMNVQLKGSFNCVQQAQKRMTENNYGKIVVITSPVPSLLRRPGQINYDAANAGLNGMTASLAIELGKHNITVNAIAPEFIQTQMTRDAIKKDGMFMDDYKKVVVSQIPARRLGTAEDVANVALFLSSDESGYVSGQIINVRGGP